MTDSLSEIDAILLAAGRSERMGKDNKLLLPYGGRPLIRHVAETLMAAGPRQLLVVLGHDAETVRRALAGLPMRMLENPLHEAGQMTSVRAGCRALDGVGSGVMIALGDMPGLRARDYQSLGEAFAAEGGERILVPLVEGQRGNPIILPAALVAEVGKGALNAGCRRLIKRYPDKVAAVEMSSPAYRHDIDTPQAYRAALSRLRGAEGLA